MAPHSRAPLLLALVATLAVAAASASAYARAADADTELLIGHDDDLLGLGGMLGGGRRRLDDANATGLDGANNATSIDDGNNATSIDAVTGASGYIGYAALSRDRVPCTQRGASYYNCRPGAEANPYSRGCSAITQCRG